MKSIKKGLTIAVSIMTAIWSVGLAAFAPVAASAAYTASEGDLVKASLAAVYYIGADGKRYVFPNENTYRTWYGADFSAVQTITDQELIDLGAPGGNVTYRPGAKLAKIETDPKVYMVGANGMFYPIADQATAVNLFGADWATMIDDIPDGFFTNYTVASDTVSAAALGYGDSLPVGTVVELDGSYYMVGESGHYMISDASKYTSVVMPTNESEFTSWMGVASSSITESSSADALVSPDREGSLEGGSATPPSESGVTVDVTKSATSGFSMSVGSSATQNVSQAKVQVCSDSSVDVEQFDLSIGAGGTAGFNEMIIWAQGPSGLIYEVSSTENNDQKANLTATDLDESINGCEVFNFYVANGNQGTYVVLVLDEVMTSGGDAASGEVVVQRPSIPVSASDIMDISFSSATGTGNLQSDGSLQKIFGIQSSVSNNDAYIPNFVFKVNGSLDAGDCEYRRNGSILSSDYDRVDDYYIFEVPSASRVLDEGSDTHELWCEVNGEAGQTVTPSSVWPAPYFHFYDNDRVKSAIAADVTTLEEIAPTTSRISNSVAARSVTGASATLEVVSLDNMMDGGVALDSEFTEGSTNVIVGGYKLKVRGDKGTLSNLRFALDDASTGSATLTNCQIKIGQRTDKAEFTTSDVDLDDYSLSNYGSNNATVQEESTAMTTVTANKKLTVGDWLIVFECDIPTTLSNGDNVIPEMQPPASANLTFDIGTTTSVPASDTQAGTITSYQLTSITTAADTTVRRIVSNATNTVIGSYTITGPSQEGATVSSVGVTFDAGIVGTSGCTTVNIVDENLDELSTSQSLTAAGTLTFTTDFDVESNEEYLLNVMCVQAASIASGATVTTATTLDSLSGTGSESQQSFSATSLAKSGANVEKAVSGTLTVQSGSKSPNQIIGPNEELKLGTATLEASVHEDQYLKQFRVDLGLGAGDATANELATVTVKAEGFTVAGTAAAAETTICTKTVTGALVTCSFSDGDVLLAAGQTGTITIYGKGNSAGNIGKDATPTDGYIYASFDFNDSSDTSSDLLTKGVQSNATIYNSSDVAYPATPGTNARKVYPSAANVRVVSNSLSSTTQPGQSNMVLANRSVIVGSKTITLTDIVGTCLTSDTTNVCRNTTDAVDLKLDGQGIGSAATLAAVGGVPTYTHASLTETVIVGTHTLTSELDAPLCSTGDTVQLTTNSFQYTVSGVGVTQTFASLTSIIPDFTTYSSNNMTHPSNLCG